MTDRIRGFEEVTDNNKQYAQEVTVHGKRMKVFPDAVLPQRSDVRSAGYDFQSPIDIKLLPAQKTILWTNVKAYMQDDEVLKLFPRSSLGVKKGLMLSNTVGIIDSSYYDNPGNEGNIGLPLLNTSGVTIEIKRGERIVQGVFEKYLTSDNGNPEDDVIREGGFGSSGE
jgi:dUTP pyrophosphatase